MWKHRDARILVNKRVSEESSEYEERNIPGILNASEWVFSAIDSNLTIYKCSDWAAGKYQEREGERNGAPEGQHRRDWHLHRENVSQHLKQSSSNMRAGIHKHFSLLLFMRKLAFTSTWRSRQLTFTTISWTLYACRRWGLLGFSESSQ